MGFLGFGRKKKILDLTEYKKEQEGSKPDAPESASQNAFSFLGSLASNSKTQSSDYTEISETANEKKRRLAKRLADMTSKMEELSNQIYHLEQRIELLEKKVGKGY